VEQVAQTTPEASACAADWLIGLRMTMVADPISGRVRIVVVELAVSVTFAK